MDKDQKEKFIELLINDTVVLGRLYAIIEELEAELDNSELSLTEYESPSFPFLKADRNGEKRGLGKIKKLLQFLKE